MKFKINITKEDNKAYFKYGLKKIHKINYVFIAIAIIIVISTVSSRSEDTTWIDIFISLIINLISWIFIFVIILSILKLVRKMTKSELSKNFGSIGGHTFTIEDDKIKEESPGSTIESNFSKIKIVGETKKHYFIILNTGHGHVFPKREIDKLKEKEKFIEIINRIKNNS